MKRILCIFLGFITLAASLTFSTSTLAAEPQLDLSVKQAWVDGNADFWLYYPTPNPHVISQLHAPQKQLMTVFELKYTLDDNKASYLKFSYGATGNNSKGRGFDADWANTADYNQITDYGTMNFYGNQKNLSIDYGRKIGASAKTKTTAFIGWTQHQSANELRDVLYYRSNNVDYDPPQSQDDIGAFYSMDFKGFHLGVEHIYQASSRLSLACLASVDFLQTSLYGEWTNHNPIWKFKDSGNCTGFELGLDVKYSVSKMIAINLGYTYYYAKSENCTRMMDSTGYGYETLSQSTDLELAQHGYYIGIAAKF
jgi:hypothetical protein